MLTDRRTWKTNILVDVHAKSKDQHWKKWVSKKNSSLTWKLKALIKLFRLKSVKSDERQNCLFAALENNFSFEKLLSSTVEHTNSSQLTILARVAGKFLCATRFSQIKLKFVWESFSVSLENLICERKLKVSMSFIE